MSSKGIPRSSSGTVPQQGPYHDLPSSTTLQATNVLSPLFSGKLNLDNNKMENPNIDHSLLKSVEVNYYASLSKSCQSKHSSSSVLIQPYLDSLQDRLLLPRIMYDDMDDKGGSFSNDKVTITKWWFTFFDGQPDFWFSLKKSNGKEYSVGTIERYMPALKNQLLKKFPFSSYLKVIEESFNSSNAKLKAMVKSHKKSNPAPPKDKVYSRRDIAFILTRCLWFNTRKHLDFFVFQTALLRLCSRASETSRLSALNLSIRELHEGGLPNSILQCYLVRDKNSIDTNHPLIPERDEVFGDLIVAIGLSLFLYDNKKHVMPSIACLEGDSVVSSYYSTTINTIFKRFPPLQSGDPIKKGTSHFGKHTAQYHLDGMKLHIAAQLFGGWKVGEGARAAYFSNPFPYLLDGAKALACWQKTGDDYQPVIIPAYGNRELGDRVCNAFFGHRDDITVEIKQKVLMCVLAKWDKLIHVIQSEPSGQFKNPRNHIIYSTLLQRLPKFEIELTEFETFKCACEDSFNNMNRNHNQQHPPPILPSPWLQTQSKVSPEYIPSPVQSSQNIRPLAELLDGITRNTDLRITLINFFSCQFMDSAKLAAPIPDKLYYRYYRVKRAIRIMVRFLDSYPHTLLSLEESSVAVNLIKRALLSDPLNVKHQGKGSFTASTPLHLSIILNNENLLTDKTKLWYRSLPPDTPHEFLEHMFPNKIYDK